MTNQEILDFPYYFEDADANSIRQYLKQLLVTLFREDEGFSGKRPFGNSSWQCDLAYALVKMGAMPGTIDEEDGYVDDYSTAGYESIIKALLNEVFSDNI